MHRTWRLRYKQAQSARKQAPELRGSGIYGVCCDFAARRFALRLKSILQTTRRSGRSESNDFHIIIPFTLIVVCSSTRSGSPAGCFKLFMLERAFMATQIKFNDRWRCLSMRSRLFIVTICFFVLSLKLFWNAFMVKHDRSFWSLPRRLYNPGSVSRYCRIRRSGKGRRVWQTTFQMSIEYRSAQSIDSTDRGLGLWESVVVVTGITGKFKFLGKKRKNWRLVENSGKIPGKFQKNLEIWKKNS